MTLQWYGFRVTDLLGFTPPLSDSTSFDFSMNFTANNNGDVIERWLFGWYAESKIEATGSGLEKMMTPLFLSLAYTPDPDSDPVGSAQAPGGAQLVRETADWRRSNFTDGSIYGVKYNAGSGAMRDIQARRTIHNKTTANVQLSASIRHSYANTSSVAFLVPDVAVMLWCEILIDHK